MFCIVYMIRLAAEQTADIKDSKNEVCYLLSSVWFDYIQFIIYFFIYSQYTTGEVLKKTEKMCKADYVYYVWT